MSNDIFTVGHSTHSTEAFLNLLRSHRIDVLADVRSSPFSRFNLQFNREELKNALKGAELRYVFLGKELGARSDDPNCYVHDKVRYDRLAESALFHSGLERVIEGAKSYRVAMMCAEKDPLECHRTILITRHLVKRGCNIIHILADGSLESHSASMNRLLTGLGMSSHDMFRTAAEIIDEAYAKQADRIAYDRSAKRGASNETDDGSVR